MFKNKKFKKFVSALCSSLLLISVAPVIKHAYADPFYTIATDENGKTYLQPKKHTTFVIVSNCKNPSEKLSCYTQHTISTFGLKPNDTTYDVKLLPEKNVKSELLALLRTIPENEQVLLGVDVSELKEYPSLHQVPYSYAVKDIRTPMKQQKKAQFMPATANLARYYPKYPENIKVQVLEERPEDLYVWPTTMISTYGRNHKDGFRIRIYSPCYNMFFDKPDGCHEAYHLHYFEQLHWSTAADLLSKINT